VVDAAFILPDDHPLKPYFTWGVNACMEAMTEQLVKSGRRVHSPPGGVFRCSGRAHWINAKRCSAWQYAWVVWSLGNAVDKGFAAAEAVRDWAAGYIVGFYISDDEFTAPDGKVYRYDPRDAIPYSTATELLETKVVPKEVTITDKDGTTRKKTVQDIKVIGTIRFLENYGEIWYYTKLNADNAYHDGTGVMTRPDAYGTWPLREQGWGHGMVWNHVKLRQEKGYGWHRYGAWVGLVSALEGGVPGARKAWQVMTALAAKKAIYGYEMVPRLDHAP
jgi:hypothetical protein